MPAVTTTREPVDPERLQDPVYVFQAMQRGQIAMLSEMHVSTLYEAPIRELLIRQAEAAHGAKIKIMEDHLARMEMWSERSKRHRNIMAALCGFNLAITFGWLALQYLIRVL